MLPRAAPDLQERSPCAPGDPTQFESRPGSLTGTA